MSRSKSFFTSFLSAFFAAFFVAGAVYAATTISTDITTGGVLTVSGLSTLSGQASTTQLSVFNRLYIGGSATTTILGDTGVSSFSGNITIPAAYGIDVATAGVLNIGTTTANAITIGKTGQTTSFPGAVSVTGYTTHTGAVTLGTASTTGDFSVGGNATTTAASGNIATAGTLTLANSSTAIGGIVFGVCGWGGNVTISASSSASFFDCTGATGLTSSHRVFVQATTSMSSSLSVQAASSTAAGTINVRLVNNSQVPVTLTSFSLNFFGIR